MRRTILLVACFWLYGSVLNAQILPVATYSDSFKFDALKADISKPGFKVQIQFEVQTGTWTDVPAVVLGTPLLLQDTLPNSLTYQVPVAPATPAGDHTLFVRYCATSSDPLVTVPICSASASIRFTLRAVDVLGAPSNLRFGPKGSGGVDPDMVSAFGWLGDVPQTVGMMGG